MSSKIFSGSSKSNKAQKYRLERKSARYLASMSSPTEGDKKKQQKNSSASSSLLLSPNGSNSSNLAFLIEDTNRRKEKRTVMFEQLTSGNGGSSSPQGISSALELQRTMIGTSNRNESYSSEGLLPMEFSSINFTTINAINRENMKKLRHFDTSISAESNRATSPGKKERATSPVAGANRKWVQDEQQKREQHLKSIRPLSAPRTRSRTSPSSSPTATPSSSSSIVRPSSAVSRSTPTSIMSRSSTPISSLNRNRRQQAEIDAEDDDEGEYDEDFSAIDKLGRNSKNHSSSLSVSASSYSKINPHDSLVVSSLSSSSSSFVRSGSSLSFASNPSTRPISPQKPSSFRPSSAMGTRDVKSSSSLKKTSKGSSSSSSKSKNSDDIIKMIRNLKSPVGKFTNNNNNNNNNTAVNSSRKLIEEKTSARINNNSEQLEGENIGENNNEINNDSDDNISVSSYGSNASGRFSSRSSVASYSSSVSRTQYQQQLQYFKDELEEGTKNLLEQPLPPKEKLRIIEERVRYYKNIISEKQQELLRQQQQHSSDQPTKQVSGRVYEDKEFLETFYHKIIQLRVLAMALTRLVYGEKSEELATALVDVGVNYMNINAAQQALPHLTKALSIISSPDFVTSTTTSTATAPKSKSPGVSRTTSPSRTASPNASRPGSSASQQQPQPQQPQNVKQAPSGAGGAPTPSSARLAFKQVPQQIRNLENEDGEEIVNQRQILPELLLILGNCHIQLKQYKTAHVILKEALRQNEILSGADDASCFKYCLALAKIYSLMGDNAKLGLEYLYKCWELKEKEKQTSTHADFVTVYNEIATIHIAEGEFTDAIDALKRAHRVNIDLFGASSIEAAGSATRLGELFYSSSLKDNVRASQYFKFAGEAYRAVYGVLDERTIEIDKKLALLQIGEFSKRFNERRAGGMRRADSVAFDVDEDLQQEMDYREQELQRGSEAEKLEEKRQFRESIARLEDVLARELQVLSSDSIQLAVTYESLGSAYEILGDFSTASLMFEKCLVINEELIEHAKSRRKNHRRKARSSSSSQNSADLVQNHPKILELVDRLKRAEGRAREQEFGIRQIEKG